MHALVIAGKKVAQFVREREPLPRRDLRRAQDDQLRLVRRRREPVETFVQRHHGHIGPECLLHQGRQVRVSQGQPCFG